MAFALGKNSLAKLSTVDKRLWTICQDAIKITKPDLIVIHGDRIEAIACSLVAATNYYLTMHIEGGEVSGTIDEIFRHCNTKLCTVDSV